MLRTLNIGTPVLGFLVSVETPVHVLRLCRAYRVEFRVLGRVGLGFRFQPGGTAERPRSKGFS